MFINPLSVFQFTGKERDAETGLDFFLARYYSGAQGRFLSVDPENAGAKNEDPQSWNAYAYSRNNPLKYTDPDGMMYQICDIDTGQCSSDTSDAAFESLYWNHLSHVDKLINAKGDAISGTMQTGAFIAGGRLYSYQWLYEDPVVAYDGFQTALYVDAAIGLAKAGAGAANAMLKSAAEGQKLAEMSGILRDAARGKGNFGIGSATKAEAEAMGEAWVGPGARVASDGKTLVSADGLRVYRPPSFKPQLGKVQANFETKMVPNGRPISNGHLDIK